MSHHRSLSSVRRVNTDLKSESEDALGVLEDQRRDGASDEDAEHVHNHLREGGRLWVIVQACMVDGRWSMATRLMHHACCTV